MYTNKVSFTLFSALSSLQAGWKLICQWNSISMGVKCKCDAMKRFRERAIKRDNGCGGGGGGGGESNMVKEFVRV